MTHDNDSNGHRAPDIEDFSQIVGLRQLVDGLRERVFPDPSIPISSIREHPVLARKPNSSHLRQLSHITEDVDAEFASVDIRSALYQVKILVEQVQNLQAGQTLLTAGTTQAIIRELQEAGIDTAGISKFNVVINNAEGRGLAADLETQVMNALERAMPGVAQALAGLNLASDDRDVQREIDSKLMAPLHQAIQAGRIVVPDMSHSIGYDVNTGHTSGSDDRGTGAGGWGRR